MHGRPLASLLVAVAVLLPGVSAAKDNPLVGFAESRNGKVVGRLDATVVVKEDAAYAVSVFYAGTAAVKDGKKGKPDYRSYAELDAGGLLGKLKYWEKAPNGEKYWMAFLFEGKVKVRHEKGPGDKGSAEELGKAEGVIPLQDGLPQLAWLRARLGQEGEFPCVSAKARKLGKATVRRVGEEEVDLPGGARESLVRWTVGGDCGTASVWVDNGGSPVVMTSGDARFDRIR